MPISVDDGSGSAGLPSSDTLDEIATANPTAANVPMNSKKLTGLANGSASSDSAAFGQIPTALPPNGSAGGDLTGTYPNPTLAAAGGGAAGPTGSATVVPIVTVDAKGRVTTLGSATIAIPESAVTSLTTDLASRVHVLATNSGAVTSGTSKTVLMAVSIPGGLPVNTVISFELYGISSSTGTLIFQILAGTNGTTADTQIFNTTTSAAQATNEHASFRGQAIITTAGSSGVVEADGIAIAQGAIMASGTQAEETTTINTTNAWFLDISCTCSAGTFTVSSAKVSA